MDDSTSDCQLNQGKVDYEFESNEVSEINSRAGLNCLARIYIHTLKDVGAWIISKVVLDHSHPCCPSKAEMLK
ncbi:hypothetical protein Ahy_A09g045856 [Arachis hypogaea]|uniref:FAR1 domain-containing protein n=1 Tax=Arachis hypogaea TaxID=3818 RepID=A0A445BNB4_ARAHY|nr:hypothetical protein Ahy_A09g045856 [Arachis hypogaea]